MKRRTKLTTATLSASAMLLVLAACGEDRQDSTPAAGGPDSTQAPSTTVKTPAKIKLGARPAGNAAAPAAETTAAGAAVDGKIAGDRMMLMRPTNYVAGAGLVDVTGAKTSWFFPAGGYVVTDEQKAALAAAFGLTQPFADLPAEYGGGQASGPTDGTGPNLTISTDAMSSWWYSGGPDTYPKSEPCTTTTDASGNQTTECPTPTPPANVPDKATAEAKATELLTKLGLDPAQFAIEGNADQWGAWVSMTLLLDGQKAPVTMYVSFGAEGVITGAGGFLARPIQGDPYDLVGVTKGIERLNDQQQGWMTLGAAGAMAKSGVATDAVAPNEVAPAPVGGEPATTAVAGTETAPPSTDALVDPVPVPTENVEPVTVTLTGAKADLTMVWDAEGTVWLLPAYTFTDDQGGIYTVIAIDDAFIELPAPMPVDVMVDPVATDTGAADGTSTDVPAATAVDQASADALVGLSEEAAVKQAEANGWTTRIAARDGESFPMTMDYRTDRVNLTVEGGLVTSVTVG